MMHDSGGRKMRKSSNKQKNLSKEQDQSMGKFILLVGGQFISSCGSGLTQFGLAIFVLVWTGSITATGIVAICAFLPAIVLAPWGGIMADRHDRRWMMIIGELLSGLGLVICLATVISQRPSYLVICLGVGVSSAFSALTEPAFKASVTDLLPEAAYTKAGGMMQIASSAKLLVSPVVAGLLLRITPVSTLIIIDILTFLTTALIILTVKRGMVTQVQTHPTTGMVRELGEGLAVVRKQSGIVPLIAIMTVAVFCLGFMQILSRPLILAFAGEAALGSVTTIIALGMLAGSGAVSCCKKIKSHVGMLAWGLIGCGVFFALVGIKENLFFIAACGFLMFAFMPPIQIGAEVLIRQNLPNEVQGRAFGLIGLITQMGYVAAYFCSGLLADYLFEPLMQGNSAWAVRFGAIIGHGAGRGNALLIVLFGLVLVAVGIAVPHIASIKNLERGPGCNGINIETGLERLQA
jgi:MFS family permease